MAKPKTYLYHLRMVLITQQALLAYVEGRLSADETVKIEELLKGDPFAQDALDQGTRKAAPLRS
jgi:anti-sigma factor RsiW